MTKRELDTSLPVQTVSGYPVRILCTDRIGETPIVGLLKKDGMECLLSWTKDGYLGDPSMRLINSPSKKKGWIKIFTDPMEKPGRGNRRTSRVYFDLDVLQAWADDHNQPGMIVEVEWEE